MEAAKSIRGGEWTSDNRDQSESRLNSISCHFFGLRQLIAALFSDAISFHRKPSETWWLSKIVKLEEK